MTDAVADPVVDALILDLLEWLASRERTYEEVMDVWRTSCPKLPVWEDATDRGLVTREDIDGRVIVGVSPSGHALLDQRRSLPGRPEAGSLPGDNLVESSRR